MSLYYIVLVFLLLANEYSCKAEADHVVDLPEDDEDGEKNDTQHFALTKKATVKAPFTLAIESSSSMKPPASTSKTGKLLSQAIESTLKVTNGRNMKLSDSASKTVKPLTQATESTLKMTKTTRLVTKSTTSTVKPSTSVTVSKKTASQTRVSKSSPKSVQKVKPSRKITTPTKEPSIRTRKATSLEGRRDSEEERISADPTSTTTATEIRPIPEYPFVVPFVYKRKYPPAPVCSGIIVTEKLILSAAYPIAIMPRGYYCALPGYSNLLTVTANEIEQNCIGIKQVYLDSNWRPPNGSLPEPLNLAVVELDRNIQFTWNISTGRIPFSTNISRFLASGDICTLAAWSYRDAIPGPGFPLKKVATQLTSEKVIISSNGQYEIFAEEGEMLHLCAANIGMPIMCKCTIVGILIPPDNVQTGYIDCTEVEDTPFLLILFEKAQRFLNVTIPASFTPNPDFDDNR